jgi:hypothetical protein
MCSVQASQALCDVYDVRDMPEAYGPFSYVPVIFPCSSDLYEINRTFNGRPNRPSMQPTLQVL